MEELTKRIETLEATIDVLLLSIRASINQTNSELSLLKSDIEIAKLEILVELEKQK